MSLRISFTRHGARFIFGAIFAVTLVVNPLPAQTGAVRSVSIRPFVTALIPVIGRNGAIGGVIVNAAGIVRRAEVSDSATLAQSSR